MRDLLAAREALSRLYTEEWPGRRYRQFLCRTSRIHWERYSALLPRTAYRVYDQHDAPSAMVGKDSFSLPQDQLVAAKRR